MKAVVTLVQVAEQHDIARHATAVDLAMQRVREAEQHAEQADGRARSAHEAVRVRRWELGRALAAARKDYPASGKNAKAWTDFLLARRMTLEQAQDAIKYAAEVDRLTGGSENPPVKFPTREEAGLDTPRGRPRAVGDDPDDTCGGQYGPRLDALPDQDRATAAPFHQLTESEVLQALARLDPEAQKRILRASKASAADDGIDRDAWCTPKWLATAIGEVDLDPCSNDRSHVRARSTFRLDFGEDGLERAAKVEGHQRVFINPPYSKVTPWIEAYLETRFVFLLKLDPSTKWFQTLIARTELVLIPRGTRVAFEPPPGVSPDKSNAQPFPHALFFARDEDATPEIRALCFAWRVEHVTEQPTNPKETPCQSPSL